MEQVRVARAHALPVREATAPRTPWQTLTTHARDRGSEAAFLVVSARGCERRTWADVAVTVELAVAGLVRSGLRSGQVVVSLLAAGHRHPELDLALRVLGAVVVHVSPAASAEDLRRSLAGVEVRLVLVETSNDIARLQGVLLGRPEVFVVDEASGWDSLLLLGAERLQMDPSLAERCDRSTDAGAADARLLSEGAPLGRLPKTAAPRAGVFTPSAITLAVGHLSDPMVQMVCEAHWAIGFALCLVTDPAAAPRAVAAAGASVVVLSTPTVEVLDRVFAAARPARRTRSSRNHSAGTTRAGKLRAGRQSRAPLIVAGRLTEPARLATAAASAVVELVEIGVLASADLPRPPPAVVGDASQLPRRSRRGPGTDFELHVQSTRAPESAASTLPAPRGSSASLPSLPLMSGESFLDKLLLSRAAEARE